MEKPIINHKGLNPTLCELAHNSAVDEILNNDILLYGEIKAPIQGLHNDSAY